jgi:TusA-related sulfurtransferase
MVEVDARGRSCPIPVVMTKKAMDVHPAEQITVIVDAEVARENVTRLARNAGYEVREEPGEACRRLVLKKRP